MNNLQQSIEYFWDYVAGKISTTTNFILIFIAIVYGIMYIFNVGYDSTDSQVHGRSGLKLHVDDMTGCHYLSSCDGGIIKRFDSKGKHICVGYNNEQI